MTDSANAFSLYSTQIRSVLSESLALVLELDSPRDREAAIRMQQRANELSRGHSFHRLMFDTYVTWKKLLRTAQGSVSGVFCFPSDRIKNMGWQSAMFFPSCHEMAINVATELCKESDENAFHQVNIAEQYSSGTPNPAVACKNVPRDYRITENGMRDLELKVEVDRMIAMLFREESFVLMTIDKSCEQLESETKLTACPAVLVSIKQVSKAVHRSESCIRNYSADWPDAIVAPGGNRQNLWDLEDIKPYLKDKFSAQYDEIITTLKS